MFWVKHKQWKVETRDNFKEDQGQRSLQKYSIGIYKCRGRVQGHHPRYTPLNSLTEDITYEAHKKAMHGEVILITATFRENVWIPKLQQITKWVIRNCFGYKRFHTKPFNIKQSGIFSLDRITGTRLIQVTGIDF